MYYYLPTLPISLFRLTNRAARLLRLANLSRILLHGNGCSARGEVGMRRADVVYNSCAISVLFVIMILLQFSEMGGETGSRFWVASFAAYADQDGGGCGGDDLKFRIVWKIFNTAFIPVIYLFFAEISNRTLEDLNAYYQPDPTLLAIRNTDAISVKQPLKYIQHEDEEMRKNAKAGGANIREERFAVGRTCGVSRSTERRDSAFP
ncbi:predicted protein [Aspergillus nidulans FGSC A4]|uniref:Uncharacterized protein n=1 Tax=Emericella nidulans (strain FGSC A4 / ATCC 38163 / CBS 112.46 / NRRL 194 / M139) TaxID=227321 RepID=Q5AXM2_EMENI|nr:hypothetical protein [Aspergillus nidulans FGSC A4]EAA57600.1 predicted protein [Aspergillus nidulans FGSC A4]CBF71829.1 TPA: conserved hypothetical protein [Aspergillus nidulans FGSC A4]|eukprot:XP_664562.1 predicted protein [Aspergillus nidulans FGSC A4]